MSHRHWFASDETRQLLVANGLADLDAAFQLGEPLDGTHETRATRHQFKRVVKLDLNSPTGAFRVYIKRQWQRQRLIPRLTDLRHGIGLKCFPIHEWRGLRILKDCGLHVAEPLALFWKGWGFARGAVVTRAVPPASSLADLLDRGELQRMSPDRRDSLVAAATGVIARLRLANVCWRSMKAKHFYPEETASGQWRIWLIDCEGVYRKASQRDWQREWKTYLKYIAAHSPSLRDAFVTAYGLALQT